MLWKLVTLLPPLNTNSHASNHLSHIHSCRTHFPPSPFTTSPEMLMKEMETVKKFAKKVKVITGRKQSQRYEYLTRDCCHEQSPPATTPTGFFAVYVGEDRQRFVVPMRFLSHPLFKMLLEKSYKEYGFEQRYGLVVPCTVSVFQEVVSAVECSHGQFDIEKLVDEFI